jgi:flagellar hook assembly protein FlgD
MKSKIKTIAGLTIVCVILALIISISIIKFSRGTSFTFMSVEKSSASRMKVSYKYFNGTDTRKISLKEGETLKIDFISEVKAGKLVINILDNNDGILKTLDSNTKGNEDIKAGSDGEYTIKVEGYKTRGSYEVNWSK